MFKNGCEHNFVVIQYYLQIVVITTLSFNTTNHSQANGQIGHINQVLSICFIHMVIPKQTSLEDYLHLLEVTYNSAKCVPSWVRPLMLYGFQPSSQIMVGIGKEQLNNFSRTG